jgi:methyl-accepting chemotaxis protein
VTQHNATAAEQLSATAEQLARQADDLQIVIRSFRLDGTKLAQDIKDAPGHSARRPQDTRKLQELPHWGKDGRAPNAESTMAASRPPKRKRTSLDGMEEL